MIFCFSATRHDWVEGTGHADKGNDVFLRAFCSFAIVGHGLASLLFVGLQCRGIEALLDEGVHITSGG